MLSEKLLLNLEGKDDFLQPGQCYSKCKEQNLESNEQLKQRTRTEDITEKFRLWINTADKKDTPSDVTPQFSAMKI